jgi:hypothetical protein
MDLSFEGKLLWIYLITKCDHAGLIRLNVKMCVFQTGIKNINDVLKEIGTRIILLTNGVYFIPKFILFQYPGFPNSKVRQQISAVDLLRKNGITIEKLNSYLTINNSLLSVNNTYDNDNGNDTEIDIGFKDNFKAKIFNSPSRERCLMNAGRAGIPKDEAEKLLEQAFDAFIEKWDTWKEKTPVQFESYFSAKWIINYKPSKNGTGKTIVDPDDYFKRAGLIP